MSPDHSYPSAVDGSGAEVLSFTVQGQAVGIRGADDDTGYAGSSQAVQHGEILTWELPRTKSR